MAAALRIYLFAWQAACLRAFASCTARIFVICAGLRIGKSRFLCAIAVAEARSGPNKEIRYAAPTGKMVKTIIAPHIRAICGELPADERPKWNSIDGRFDFPNGSKIWVAGCEDMAKADHLRGNDTHLFIVDEAGFIDILDYVVRTVLMPQTITVNGRGIVASSPAVTPDHDFRTYCLEAEEEGRYFHATIDDADPSLVTPEIRAEYCRDAGGEKSTKWLREYMAQHVTDETMAVVPEFAAVESTMVRKVEPAEYRDCYVAIDVGYTDLTVALFGWYDFKQATIVVEDERVFVRQTSGPIAAECLKAEAALWGDKAPRLRVCDAPEIVLQDMSLMHKYDVRLPVKDDREAAVNAMRTAVADCKIAIDPRCSTLIAHLRHAIWNTQRTSFARSSGAGHFDALDALIYLVRTVDRNRNPYPRLDPSINRYTHHVDPKLLRDATSDKVAGAFFPKMRRIA